VWLVVFLGLPSLYSVEKFTGVVGLVLYVVALPAGIAFVRSWLWTPRSGRDIALLTALVALLVVGLLVLYPLADSGRIGGGSDNGEALNLATRALVRGDDPYARDTYLGNPVAVLPGALVLSAPFALYGNIAVSVNAFWLGALVLVLWRVGRGADASASTLGLGLFLCVAGLNTWIVGSDRLGNTICVLLLSIGVCALASQDHGSFPLAGCALVLGIGLSWRINFVLVVPPLLAFVAARARMAGGGRDRRRPRRRLRAGHTAVSPCRSRWVRAVADAKQGLHVDRPHPRKGAGRGDNDALLRAGRLRHYAEGTLLAVVALGLRLRPRDAGVAPLPCRLDHGRIRGGVLGSGPTDCSRPSSPAPLLPSGWE
jgi:hypothetical protein